MSEKNSFVADLRKEYTLNGLTEQNMRPNPIEQFDEWFQDALQANVHEPNAMHLATVSAAGTPKGRIVLLKGLDENGFAFYTNYESQKGNDLSVNSAASLTFFWPELERQVRIEGLAHKLSAAESDAYFQSRPRNSRLGAWVSAQSRPIADRSLLEKHEAELEKQFENQEIGRPPHWGGFRVVPNRIEFWQGRPSRLHDRVLYTLEGSRWQLSRLQP